MPTDTGIFTLEDAENGHLFSAGLCSGIIALLDKDIPIIDLGCGEGKYVNEFTNSGFEAYGVDGLFLPMHGDNISIFDLTLPYSAPIKGNIVCLEVGEHIPVEYEKVLLDTIKNNCLKTVVLSWAVINQGGIGHVNCRNNDYIIQQMIDRGFVYCEKETNNLRSCIEDTYWYFRSTIMVFKIVN